MAKCCRDCLHSYSSDYGFLFCGIHRNSYGDNVRVKTTATCDFFEPRDTSDQIRNNSGCFLSTACVNYFNLDDDCYFLTRLRWFRDNILLKTNEGKELVDVYYQIAPKIVQCIEKKENRASWYQYIYQCIEMCVELIDNKNYISALNRYREMVLKLQKEVLI